MGKHSRPLPERTGTRWFAGVGGVLVAVIAIVAWRADAQHGGPIATTPAQASNAAKPCGQVIRAVTAASFAPVLNQIAHKLGTGADCIDVETTVADGRQAAAAAHGTDADVWIPDARRTDDRGDRHVRPIDLSARPDEGVAARHDGR